MQIFAYESLCAGALGHPSESLLREGRAMLSAIVADFLQIPNVEVVTLLEEQTPFGLGGRCVRTAAADERARFCELAGQADWTMVIAPEFGDMLRQRSQDVLDAGGRLLGSSPDAIVLAGDKFALANHFKLSGISHPKTELVDLERYKRKRCPFILKPRHGAGSQATFLVPKASEKMRIWAEACREWPENDFIVQNIVKGRAASVAVLCGVEDFIVLHPAWQNISNDGRFRYRGGVVPIEGAPAISAQIIGEMVADFMDELRGFFGIDMILGSAGPVVIEINPRLTTSYIGLRRLCRDNLALAILRLAMGEDIGEFRWTDETISFTADGKVSVLKT